MPLNEPNPSSQMDELDDFSLLTIFDKLDLPSLLNMASLNGRFHYLISTYNIRNRLDNKTICLVDDDDSQCSGAQYVSINKIETILKLLQYYGDRIKSLKYDLHNARPHEQQTIVDYIERYCSKTLSKIALFDMAAFSQTFENVKSVDLQQFDYSSELFIRERFPKMETFHFSTIILTRFPTIEKFFPNLLNLRIDSGDSEDINAGLKVLIQLNPQIRSLQLNRFPNFQLLQFASQNLPALESLTLAYPQSYKPIVSYELGDTVHFPRVRLFRIIGEYNSLHLQLPFSRFPLTFERLERLDIVSPTIDTLSAQLIRHNRQLKSLSMPMISEDSYKEVLYNVRQLKELEETTLRWPNRFNADDVEHLMHDFGRLKKVSFIVTNDEESGSLNAVCSDEWLCSERGGFDDKEIITLVPKKFRLS